MTRGGFESPAATFLVTEARTPVVTMILPSRVQAGERAVIRGSDLGGPLDTVLVTFSGVAATSVLPLSQTLVVDLPGSAVSKSRLKVAPGALAAGVALVVLLGGLTFMAKQKVSHAKSQRAAVEAQASKLRSQPIRSW